MKDYLLFILLLCTYLFSQDNLEVGMKAAGWELKDAGGKLFTMESWSGKILQINYVDPDESVESATSDAAAESENVEPGP